MAERALSLRNAQIRSLRLQSQGLDGSSSLPPPHLVDQHGFVRTLGGVDAYLALQARHRNLHRDELDDCLVDGSLQVLPAVRGCIYLVRQQDRAACLRIAYHLSAARNARDLDKAGVSQQEVSELGLTVLETLQTHGPMTTDVLRKALPEGSVRSLGDKGKKVGVSSPLPPALRQLEFEGRIGRMPEGNRLDTERYLWRPIVDDAFAEAAVPDDPALLASWLLDRFLDQTAVATLVQFRNWSGLTASVAKAALENVEHVAIVRENGTQAIASPDIEARLDTLAASQAACAMLPAMDNLVHLPGGAQDLVDEEYLDLAVASWGRQKPATLRDASHPAYRLLIADGRVSGFWEYDPDAGVAVPFCFRKPSRAAQMLIEDISGAVSTMLRDELGHGRSFSLDTDEALRERIAKLRTLTGTSGKTASAAGRRVAKSSRTKKAPATKRPTASKPRAKKAAR